MALMLCFVFKNELTEKFETLYLLKKLFYDLIQKLYNIFIFDNYKHI